LGIAAGKKAKARVIKRGKKGTKKEGRKKPI